MMDEMGRDERWMTLRCRWARPRLARENGALGTMPVSRRPFLFARTVIVTLCRAYIVPETSECQWGTYLRSVANEAFRSTTTGMAQSGSGCHVRLALSGVQSRQRCFGIAATVD